MMKGDKLDHYRKLLLRMKDEEQAIAARISQGLSVSMADSLHELSFYDNHPGDVATETFERGKDIGLKNFAADRLAMIDRALDRITKGSYGRCESCGKNIDGRRLAAVPYTELCLDCQMNNEDVKKLSRPVEEDVIPPPFGGNYREQNNAYDGEDAWQEAARYGTSESPSDIGQDLEDYGEVYLNSKENRGIVEDYEGKS